MEISPTICNSVLVVIENLLKPDPLSRNKGIDHKYVANVKYIWKGHLLDLMSYIQAEIAFGYMATF